MGAPHHPTLVLVALLVLLGAPGAAASAAADEVKAAEAQLMPIRGTRRRVMVEEGQTLLQIAVEHRIGFESLQGLNPGVDPWIPNPGMMVELPTRYIVPAVEPEGVVINIPEMRLYDFTVDPVRVFAVAVGDPEDPTPVGHFHVGTKRVDPAWNVPESIRKEKPALPAVVPAGPENPLGSRWMTIGSSSYGIHGTSTRWSIGRMATHGCVRLYEDDIQRLFEAIPSGTPLNLVYLPFKWGVHRGQIYFEAHPDLYQRIADPLRQALVVPRHLGLLRYVDVEAVWAALEAPRGAPLPVGRLPADAPPTSIPKS